MIIKNACYDKDDFCDDHYYIFSIGYEHRSFFLYDELATHITACNSMIFTFSDYEQYPHALKKIKEIKKNNLEIIIENYSSNDVQRRIVDQIKNLMSQSDAVTIHIDYSSMPRSWYCKLPIILKTILRHEDKIFFWYSEGEYPTSYEEYPSSGIDAFSFFSGKPSLQIENNRLHVIALGFDSIRTQAILSITDPDYLVACYAYDPIRKGFQESIKNINEHILSRAAMTLALHLDNFSFMVSKLCETANELLPAGDVIFIPDGPKPLIFAISLVPDLVKKVGVTCLHVSRNIENFKAVDVTPTGTVYGFSICLERNGIDCEPSHRTKK